MVIGLCDNWGEISTMKHMKKHEAEVPLRMEFYHRGHREHRDEG